MYCTAPLSPGKVRLRSFRDDDVDDDDVADNNRSFRFCLPSLRSPRSPTPRREKDVENASRSQKFVELPRSTSPFYRLPKYTRDDQDAVEYVRANSGPSLVQDRRNASNSGTAAAGYGMVHCVCKKNCSQLYF